LSKHEHFEELAAIAALQELTPSQSEELHLHLADCGQCRKIYEQYEELHAPLRQTLDPETEALIESRRASAKAGVLAVIGKLELPAETPIPSAARNRAIGVRWSMLRPIWFTVGVAMALGIFFWLGARYEQRASNNSAERQNVKSAEPVLPSAVIQAPAAEAQKPSQTEIMQSAQLANELRAEKQRSAQLDSALTARDRTLAESESERLTLRQQLTTTTEEDRETKSLLAVKTEELQRVESSKPKDATELDVLRSQVQDLTERLNEQTESLGRERQLLANGRDIRDIIGARNLHIIDVYDTDAKGATDKSFARAFYTEGKSLIFYAYDLPARRTEDGKYVYAAWGERNGDKKNARHLGVLLNDDKGQKRWVLNFTDPKTLAEIDSVFITLERVDADKNGPSGKRMLTAYLDSQPNHP
jgi:hypothetical protein